MNTLGFVDFLSIFHLLSILSQNRNPCKDCASSGNLSNAQASTSIERAEKVPEAARKGGI